MVSNTTFAGYITGFVVPWVAVATFAFVWFWRRRAAAKKESIEPSPRDYSLYIPYIAECVLLSLGYLAEFVPTNSENTFVLRTTQVLGLATQCSESLTTDGVCGAWIHWLFYIPVFALYVIPLCWLLGFGRNWSALFQYSSIGLSLGLTMATVLGDTTVKYVAFGFGALCGVVMIVTLIIRFAFSFSGPLKEKRSSFMRLYEGHPAGSHILSRWAIRIVTILAALGFTAYVILWPLGPAGQGYYDLKTETWILVAVDIVFLVITPLIAAWAWPYVVQSSEGKELKLYKKKTDTVNSNSRVKGQSHDQGGKPIGSQASDELFNYEG